MFNFTAITAKGSKSAKATTPYVTPKQAANLALVQKDSESQDPTVLKLAFAKAKQLMVSIPDGYTGELPTGFTRGDDTHALTYKCAPGKDAQEKVNAIMSVMVTLPVI